MLDAGHTQTFSIDVQQRLEFLGINQNDFAFLKRNKAIPLAVLPKVIDRFREKLFSKQHLKDRFENSSIPAVENALIKHFSLLIEGDVGERYKTSVSRVGIVHAKLKLEPVWQVNAYSTLITDLNRSMVKKAGFFRRGTATRLGCILTRLMMMDLEIALSITEEMLKTRAQAQRERLSHNFRSNVSNTVQTLAATSLQTSDSIRTASTAADQLATSITAIRDQMNDATTKTRSAASLASASNAQVSELASKVSDISDAVRMISEIANKTNLLALNASIEAARAGQVGRGFSVVAGEVKNLAAQTTNVTENINNHIAAIRDATERTVHNVTTISKECDEVDTIAQSVRSGLDEQASATRDITLSVGQARTGSDSSVQQSRTLQETTEDFFTSL